MCYMLAGFLIQKGKHTTAVRIIKRSINAESAIANSLLIPKMPKKNTRAASLVPMPEMLTGSTDKSPAMLTEVARCTNDISIPKDFAREKTAT